MVKEIDDWARVAVIGEGEALLEWTEQQYARDAGMHGEIRTHDAQTVGALAR